MRGEDRGVRSHHLAIAVIAGELGRRREGQATGMDSLDCVADHHVDIQEKTFLVGDGGRFVAAKRAHLGCESLGHLAVLGGDLRPRTARHLAVCGKSGDGVGWVGRRRHSASSRSIPAKVMGMPLSPMRSAAFSSHRHSSRTGTSGISRSRVAVMLLTIAPLR